jgi:hypothetical protein
VTSVENFISIAHDPVHPVGMTGPHPLRSDNLLTGTPMNPLAEARMAVKLNDRSYQHARRLIEQGRSVLDERDQWSEHRPSAQQENTFISEQGIAEYQKWYLGIDDAEPEDTKARYKFPYGDFAKVHRCGVLSAEVRAGQYKYDDIETAAAHLHGMLDGVRIRE